jgi:hypothetical protein
MRRHAVPQLVLLRFGSVYCELCRATIHAGERVGWWKVPAGRRKRPSAYCKTCHVSNVKQRKALR